MDTPPTSMQFTFMFGFSPAGRETGTQGYCHMEKYTVYIYTHIYGAAYSLVAKVLNWDLAGPCFKPHCSHKKTSAAVGPFTPHYSYRGGITVYTGGINSFIVPMQV